MSNIEFTHFIVVVLIPKAANPLPSNAALEKSMIVIGKIVCSKKMCFFAFKTYQKAG